jgi:hypothetical protein
MAKIKLRFGENEVEIESRDFYIDNETLGDVISSVTRHMEENKARIIIENQPGEGVTQDTLSLLEDAEVYEPEFTNPIAIPTKEIHNKLKILDKNSFFNIPRTVSETVEQLREHGWSTSPLDVSKALAKMSFNREISKHSKNNRMFYSTKQAVIVS